MIRGAMRSTAANAAIEVAYNGAKAVALLARCIGKRRVRLRPRATPRPYQGLRRRKITLAERAMLHGRAAAEFAKVGVLLLKGALWP